MLLVADAERLLLLNEFACRIWKGLAAGLTPDEIVAALAGANGEGADTIRTDVERVVAQTNALLDETASPPCPADPSPPLSREPLWAAQWMCRVRGHQFSLAVENSAHGRQLKLLLGHLEVEDGVAEMRLEVRDAGGGRSAIFQDGCERARISGVAGLRGTIHAAMIEHLWPDRPFCALIHGGAVALGRSRDLLPGLRGKRQDDPHCPSRRPGFRLSFGRPDAGRRVGHHAALADALERETGQLACDRGHPSPACGSAELRDDQGESAPTDARRRRGA